ncbi:MAG: nicotinate (nicotinamide) nucleotide adenylyltransferase [Bacteroidales bacterium]|nr:nicotinate (nicotinamide) nucleotide adenylyltransferase [Bacteroidales bacterium]
MDVALYFGSFNPLHIGHISICKYLLKATNIDELRLIVSPLNPLKNKSSAINSKERLQNVKEAVKKATLGNRVVVSNIEYKMTPPLYTINTLNKLRQEEPNNNFILIIGADNLEIIEKWHKWEEILKEFPVWVYPRSGFNAEKLCKKYRCKLLTAPLIEISSTQIREAEKAGVDMSNLKA